MEYYIMGDEPKNPVEVLEGIAKQLKRSTINTDNMFNESGIDESVLKIVRKSNLVESAWNEVIKAKAIVNPSEYIGDRAEAVKKANTTIAKEVQAYYDELVKDEKNPLPNNTIKSLLARKLLTSAGDHYMEINTKYPINNLATSLQNAINQSTMNPTEKAGEVSKSRKRRKK